MKEADIRALVPELPAPVAELPVLEIVSAVHILTGFTLAYRPHTGARQSRP